MFQEHGGPCTHAIMAARARRVDPYTLFSNAFTLSTYRYTYQASIHPVIVRDLEPGPGCLPPLISKKRGRPKTTRIRKQERHQKKKKCSIHGVDKKVTINAAAEQPMIAGLWHKEWTV